MEADELREGLEQESCNEVGEDSSKINTSSMDWLNKETSSERSEKLEEPVIRLEWELGEAGGGSKSGLSVEGNEKESERLGMESLFENLELSDEALLRVFVSSWLLLRRVLC